MRQEKGGSGVLVLYYDIDMFTLLTIELYFEDLYTFDMYFIPQKFFSIKEEE